MRQSHKRRRRPLPSADEIAGNEDLMTEILIRLPAKSLCRFKSVSKRWYSIISHPDFSLLRVPHSTSGIFFSISSRFNSPLYTYVHLAGRRMRSPPFKSLTVADYSSDIRIAHSCNGLFLLSSTNSYWVNAKHYIYNPTTNQFAIIPTPSDDSTTERSIPSLNLAFDSTKAPHYRVILVRSRSRGPTHQIEIYSSETRAWRISGDPFFSNDLWHFRNGVFFNGTMHWLSSRLNTALRFDINMECLGTMSMPTTQDATFVDCPRLTQDSILHLIIGEVEEELALVLRIPGMIVSYNFKDKSIKKLCNLVRFGVWPPAHRYIETFFRI